MAQVNQKMIHDLLVRDLSRELVLGLEEAALVGAQRAYDAARGIAKGHWASAIGQLRHFHMNESFHLALTTSHASPSPLRSNQIVTGRAGIFNLARFNIKHGEWISGRRSETRKQMARANAAIEPLIQPSLFSDHQEEPSQAVAFIVASFAKQPDSQPEVPISVEIAVPDRHMQSWLFREPVDAFIKRYEHQPAAKQDDLAIPKLKKHIGKRQDKDGTGS
jgi:hypothetical protein